MSTEEDKQVITATRIIICPTLTANSVTRIRTEDSNLHSNSESIPVDTSHKASSRLVETPLYGPSFEEKPLSRNECRIDPNEEGFQTLSIDVQPMDFNTTPTVQPSQQQTESERVTPVMARAEQVKITVPKTKNGKSRQTSRPRKRKSLVAPMKKEVVSVVKGVMSGSGSITNQE